MQALFKSTRRGYAFLLWIAGALFVIGNLWLSHIYKDDIKEAYQKALETTNDSRR